MGRDEWAHRLSHVFMSTASIPSGNAYRRADCGSWSSWGPQANLVITATCQRLIGMNRVIDALEGEHRSYRGSGLYDVDTTGGPLGRISTSRNGNEAERRYHLRGSTICWSAGEAEPRGARRSEASSRIEKKHHRREGPASAA